MHFFYTAWLPLWCGLLWVAAAEGYAAPQAPDVVVRETADRVLEVIRADPDVATGNTKRIGEVVETYLLEHFDFARMTRLAVGKNWRSIDEAQKPALIREFQTLLVRTYSGALAEYRDQEIEYKPLTLKPGAQNALVQTTITRSNSKPISMNYRMVGTEAGWKVYDVIVEGVSLVINYRSLFDSTVESSGVDGLIQLLREKNAAAK